MKKKRVKDIRFLAVLLCAALFLSACSSRTNVDEDDDYIYCLNGDRTGLVKIAYDIPEGTPAEAAKQILEELAKPSEDIEYVPPIPEGVEILECRMERSIAYIDFNEEYLKIPLLEEKIIRAAIAQSILRVNGISGVWFSVNGESLKGSDGKQVGLMNMDDFVQNTGSSLSSYQTATLTLYFANASGDQLVGQKMEANYTSNMPLEKLIVEKLMGGPKKSGVYPTLNPAASLLGVTSRDGICYVNFDSEFLNSIYDVKPEVTIYSLVNSLVGVNGIETVQITVNGETNVKYMDTVDLSKPLKKDMTWIENMEGE